MIDVVTGMAGHAVFLVPQTHPTIQAAIDAASGPTTIVVAPGVYEESLRVSGREYIVLQSARLTRRGVVLAGSGSSGAVVAVESSALHLSGIVVRSRGDSRGIVAVDATIGLQDCVVAGNRAARDGEPFGAGMLCRRATVHLQKSVISANTIEADAAPVAGGAGLFMQECRAEIAGCTLQLNEVFGGGEARGGGVWCEETKLRMWRSRVTDNTVRGRRCQGGGIVVLGSRDVQLGGSVITGNDAGEAGRGGGVFVAGDGRAVSIHRNTFVRQNNPDDVAGDEPR